MKTLIYIIFFLLSLTGAGFLSYETYTTLKPKLLGGVQYLNITGHVSSTGTPPTLVAGGTDYVASSVGAGATDYNGSFTGVVPGGAGQLQLKFVSSYNFAPNCTANIASAQPTTTFYVTSSISGFALNFIAGNVSGTKTFTYFCAE